MIQTALHDVMEPHNATTKVQEERIVLGVQAQGTKEDVIVLKI